jgi:Flp pilus assembly protein TadG
MRKLRRLLAASDGVVAIETALVLSLFLVPLLLGIIDVSQIALGKAKVDEALQDAMTYVMSAGSASTNAAITSAAQAANGSGITVSTSTVCYCVSTGSSLPTAPSTATCGHSCSSGFVLQQFMSIAVSNRVTIPFPVPFINLTSPMTVTSTGQVRTG